MITTDRTNIGESTITSIISATEKGSLLWRALPPNVWIARDETGEHTYVLQYYKGTYILDVIWGSSNWWIQRATELKYDSKIAQVVKEKSVPYR